VSTALVSSQGSGSPFGGFHAAFVLTVVMAVLGALVAWFAFPRETRTVAVESNDEEVPAVAEVVPLAEVGA
jgi:hypothetical protein